jgi:6-phosphogluconate dehydrogenase
MHIGMIGLGRMGGNMVRRLMRAGHKVTALDASADAVRAVAAEGAIAASSPADLAAKVPAPRAVWVMLPAGEVTEKMIDALAGLLAAGDVVVDGGNTLYKDDLRRAERLAGRGIHYVDQGTSGGVWGLAEGYSLMIGGDAAVVERLRPVFAALAPAPDKGWARVGPVGAGHFVKMVHNGIEYGLMQAYAEGFELLKAKKEFGLDVRQVAEVWRHGSVVRSWLLDLIARALEGDPELGQIKGWVADSGEGRWTIHEAIDCDVPVPTIALSLFTRFYSRNPDSYANKLLAAMRNQFGGHAVKKG